MAYFIRAPQHWHSNVFLFFIIAHNSDSCKMKDKITTPKVPAHRVTNDVPEDDFVPKVTPISDTSKALTKKKRKATFKKAAPDPPSNSPVSMNLTQKLVEAGLPLKHQLSDSHISKTRQARKAKYDKIIRELDEAEARQVKNNQGTLMAYWEKEELNHNDKRPEVMTQFTQMSQESATGDSEEFSLPSQVHMPKIYCAKSEEEDAFQDDIPLPDSGLNKFKYRSSVTNVSRTVRKEVEVYDLTHHSSSDEGETKKRECKPCFKKEVKVKEECQNPDKPSCTFCLSPVCHNTLFGNYCFARIQKYFSEDKLLANKHSAEKIYVKAYNSALDFHMYTSTSSLMEYPTLFPPACIQSKSMKVSLQWFDTEKEKYSRYICSSSVANRRVKKRENFKKEWEAYEERISKRRNGGIVD